MILLSAGHNPASKGASYKGFNEYDEAVLWVAILAPLLNAVVVPTGSLRSKINFINERRAKLAIEIHFNSALGKVKGSETLYCPGSREGFRAAVLVQNSLSSLMPPNRGAKEGWYRMDSPDVVDYPGDIKGDENLDAFLSQTRWPAIIIEPEFIQNKCTIQCNREICCELIAEAVTEFLR